VEKLARGGAALQLLRAIHYPRFTLEEDDSSQTSDVWDVVMQLRPPSGSRRGADPERSREDARPGR